MLSVLIMAKKTAYTQPLTLLKSASNSVLNHPVILLPFATIALVQLLILEILYFSVRQPLVSFFGPVIRRAGEAYLHYPFNFVFLPELFQYFQVPIYIFISSFFTGTAVLIIADINNNKNVEWAASVKRTLSRYVHLVTAAVIAWAVFYGAQVFYEYWFVTYFGITQGRAMAHLFIGVAVTALFAFVFPLIMIEKKKVFSALFDNLKGLWNSWPSIFIIVLLPTLFYIPILLLKGNVMKVIDETFPEMVFVLLIIGIFALMIIDAIIYTAITTFYLWRREQA